MNIKKSIGFDLYIEYLDPGWKLSIEDSNYGVITYINLSDKELNELIEVISAVRKQVEDCTKPI